ncbi:MAG: hypothetical protein RMM29_09075 [Planctomycetota bacterium]|nr:hypothetical protein [Planctomycetota bacterium]
MPAEQTLNALAVFMAERYGAIAGTLAKMKRAINQNGGHFNDCLAQQPPRVISDCCQWCTRLHELGFLEEYHYKPAPQCQIVGRVSSLPLVQGFLSGHWLERAVLELLRARAPAGVGFESLLNPQIVLPNGNDFELDVLAAIGEQVWWVEAKTGDYQPHLAKYAAVQRLLQVAQPYAVLVLPDLPSERCRTLTQLYSLTVCNIADFVQHVAERTGVGKETEAALPVAEPPAPPA